MGRGYLAEGCLGAVPRGRGFVCGRWLLGVGAFWWGSPPVPHRVEAGRLRAVPPGVGAGRRAGGAPGCGACRLGCDGPFRRAGPAPKRRRLGRWLPRARGRPWPVCDHTKLGIHRPGPPSPRTRLESAGRVASGRSVLRAWGVRGPLSGPAPKRECRGPQTQRFPPAPCARGGGVGRCALRAGHIHRPGPSSPPMRLGIGVRVVCARCLRAWGRAGGGAVPQGCGVHVGMRGPLSVSRTRPGAAAPRALAPHAHEGGPGRCGRLPGRTHRPAPPSLPMRLELGGGSLHAWGRAVCGRRLRVWGRAGRGSRTPFGARAEPGAPRARWLPLSAGAASPGV
jgi:hypothetical protein